MSSHPDQITTEGVRVEVLTQFVPEQSDAKSGRYLFAYQIRITNTTSETIQLLSRHWIITDGWGREEEVKGPGVVGEQPIIAPGDHFEYQRFCPLPTPTGSMRGWYQMITENKPISVEIPQFFLVEPGSFH